MSATLTYVLPLGPRPLRGVLWSTRRRGASFMSVPNLKRIALFIQKLLGSQNFELGSRYPGHVHLGDVLWSIRNRDPSSISVPNLKPIAQFVQKLLRESQNYEIRFTLPRPRPIMGRFLVPTQGGSVLHVCTKFEVESYIRSKVIRGSKISKVGHVTQAPPI